MSSGDLDPVLHAAPRLRIAVALDTLGPGDQLSFPRLQRLLGMTSGNLASHLRRLEDERYVAVDKTHEGRTPVTYVSLTPAGRAAFAAYRETLSRMLDLEPARPSD